MRALILLSMVGACALAGDISGRWSGKLGDAGEPIAFELRQAADRLIGVALLKDGDVGLLLDGKTDGRKASFRIEIKNEEASFELIADGDKLSGRVLHRKDDKDADSARVVASHEIPGDAGPLTGVWNGTLEPPGEAAVSARLRLRQSGDKLSGSLSAGRYEGVLKDVSFANGRLVFAVEDTHFELRVSGDQMAGQVTRGNSEKDVAKYTAVRQAAVATSGVSGRWVSSILVSDNGGLKRFPGSFEFAYEGSDLSGAVNGDTAKTISFKGGKVSGGSVTFSIDTGRERVRFELTLAGDELTGHATETRDGREIKYEVLAVRRMD